MRCPGCGMENSEEANFCTSCGASLDVVIGSAPSLTQVAPAAGFVGRHQELQELKSALDDALSGRGRLAMLVGEPGIGKTRTAQELAVYAETQGAQVLWGRCYEWEGAPPYWPWVQLLRSYVRLKDPERLRVELGTEASDIAEVVPALRDKLPNIPTPATLEPEQARFHLFDSITTFLKNASRGQPLMLVLDDLHWADQSSLLLLEFLASELDANSLLVLGTYRDIEVSRQHPLAQTLGNLIKASGFLRLQIAGLSQPEVEQLINDTAGATCPPQLIENIYRRTEGNPLFVSEITRAISRAGSPENWEIMPNILGGVNEVIGRRLNRLSDGCVRMLTTASVIGREFDFKLLEALTYGPVDEHILELLDEAREAHLVEELPWTQDRYQFTHALIQETLLQELSPSRRVRAHAHVGEVMEEVYSNQLTPHAAELAHHFAQSEGLLGPEKMVSYSLMAGKEALSVYAYEEALGHFERALKAKPGLPMDLETADILFGLGCSYIGTYRGQEGLEKIRQAFDYYYKVGDIDKVVELVEYRMSLPVWEQDVSYLVSRALQLIPPDSRQAAEVMSAQGVFLLIATTGGGEAIMETVDRALAIARREQDILLEMKILSNASVMLYATSSWELTIKTGLSAISLAQQAQSPTLEATARGTVARSLACIGDLQGAKSQSVEMLAAMENMAQWSWKPIGFTTMTFLSWLEGDWGQAIEYNNRVLAQAPRAWDALLLRVLLEYEHGNLAEGRGYLDQMIDTVLLDDSRQIHERIFAMLGVAMAGYIIGSTDNLDVAQSVAQSLLDTAPEMPLQYATSARISLALCSVLEGNHAKASEQYLALQSTAGQYVVYISGDRLLGLLAQTLGHQDKAVQHFEDALSFCRKTGYRPQLAWVCYEYADTLLRRSSSGDTQKASQLLEESLAIARELGMPPLFQRAQQRVGQVEVRPRPAPTYPDGLTQREVEVLRLIADGKTNREIAEELTISATTANTHVQNIFSKIAVANRTEAAMYAARHGLV